MSCADTPTPRQHCSPSSSESTVASLEPLVDARFPAYALHGIEAEWFPPRKFHTQDRSGFDIAALVRLADDRRMLVTIEVKYTDSFSSTKLDPDRQPYPAYLAALGLEQDQHPRPDRLGWEPIPPLAVAHRLSTPSRDRGREQRWAGHRTGLGRRPRPSRRHLREEGH